MSMAPLNYMHAIVAPALSAAPEEPAVLRASHTAAERLVETGNFYLATGVSAVRPVDSHSGVSIPRGGESFERNWRSIWRAPGRQFLPRLASNRSVQTPPPCFHRFFSFQIGFGGGSQNMHSPFSVPRRLPPEASHDFQPRCHHRRADACRGDPVTFWPVFHIFSPEIDLKPTLFRTI